MINRLATVLIIVVAVTACSSTPPEQQDDICEIYFEKRSWYKDSRKSQKRWGSPIPVMMAFMHQESSFRAKAKPPRKKLLGFIPWKRPATAKGYSQATNETWAAYQKSTGRWRADRNNFGDAIDFIGWYNNESNKRNKIRKDDPYHLYLAYHEGQGGFARRSFRNKQWLKDVATKVSARSNMYGKQLKGCEKKLRKGFFGRLMFWT